ncbi:TonB-dependent receptor [Rosenbergiella collisarenosi]|uniref:TonB-dependent receptor n=1 Tax=Rosenbergiella collisarenosi TaxID=1544695 RepID=UPI001F4FC7E4|nr:TonB-dependent siderophore receptor [Rosenbergiella collisarenosi]
MPSLGTPSRKLCLAQAISLSLLPLGAIAATPADTLVVTATPAATDNANGQHLIPAFLDGNIANGGRLGALGEQKALDVPFNIVGYTATLIEHQQARTLADVMKNDASVQNVRGYGNFSQGFRIRGFDLYADDISFGGLYGILPRQILPLEAVERVEVIKGSSAFLNGVPAAGTGVGGNVNIEPKRADELPVQRVTVDYTGRGQAGVSADIGRRFGDNDQFGVRANVVQREGETEIHHQRSRTTGAFLGLDYRGEKLESSLDMGYVKSTIHHGRVGIRLASIDNSISLPSIPSVPSNRDNYSPSWNYADLETRYAMIKNDYHLNDRWVAYSAIGSSQSNEWSSSGAPVVSNLNGDAKVTRLNTHYKSDTTSGMIGLRGKVDSGPVSHQLNINYSGIFNRTASAYTMSAANSFGSIYHPIDFSSPVTTYSGGDMANPHVRSKTVNNGVAISDTLGFLHDRILFTAGARYQHIDVKNYSYAGVQDKDAALKAQRWSPVYGLVYKATDWLSLYANHIEGLQASDAAPSTTLNSGYIVGLGRTRQNEVGIKVEKGRFGGNIALFDLRRQVGLTGSDNVYRLAGEQRNQGVEVNLFGEPVLGWRINAGSTWLRPKMANANGYENKRWVNYGGNDAVGVPRNQWTLGTEWDIPHVEGLMAQANLFHSSRQYVNSTNTLRIPSWTRLDMGVQYTMPLHSATVSAITWRAGVENVTNEKYWETVGTNNGYLTQGDPRTYKLSMSLDF